MSRPIIHPVTGQPFERRELPTMPMLRGLPRGRARVIAADVPWNYVVWSAKGLDRSAEQHYDTMSLEEIAQMPVADYADPNSRLMFWVTGPFMALGAHVYIMRAWGFEPVATWGVWIKPTREAYYSPRTILSDDSFKMNMGHTSRQNAEFVIEGRRGDPPARKSKSIRQVMIAPPFHFDDIEVMAEPQREHSRKPEKFFQRVEQYADGPYLELFGRQRRRGWTVRGNEVDKFAPR